MYTVGIYKKVILFKEKEINKHLDNLSELKKQRMNYRIYREFFYEGMGDDEKKSLDRRISIIERNIEFEGNELRKIMKI